MERRGKPKASATRGGLSQELTSNPTSSLPDLPHIEGTIARGEITIGIIPPIKECVAIAHEGRRTLAMLKQRNGESLMQLLTRLDLAIALAHTADIFTDEINQPANAKRP